MARSNVFAVFENVFMFGMKKEITQITVEAFEMLNWSLHDKYDEQSRFMILVKAARLGVASEDGTLNRNEKSWQRLHSDPVTAETLKTCINLSAAK